MAKRVRLCSAANRDMAELINFVAPKSLDGANRLIDSLTERFELLGAQPELGAVFPHPRLQLRRTSVANYLIFYQVTPDEVVIYRIFHGARDWEKLL